MIALWCATLLSATVLVEQELPTLRVGDVNPLTGHAAVNFQRADLNGDGYADLIIEDTVAFQHNGGYDENHVAPLPRAEEQPRCDVSKGTLYLLFHDSILLTEWNGHSWRTVLEQPMQWPEAPTPAAALEAPELLPAKGLRLARFLHDFNGDGTAEIVLPQADGVHLYRKIAGRYVTAGVLDVFPPPRARSIAPQTLWPATKRTLSFPSPRMDCRILLNGNNLTVVSREPRTDTQVRYRTVQHPIRDQGTFAIDAQRIRERTSGLLPGYMLPCRLNSDEQIDYAGTNWSFTPATTLPTPVIEARATTDNGETVTRRRSRAFRTNTAFTDYDADGDLDLVQGHAHMFSGGSREALNRFMTQRTIRHEVRVFLQDAVGGFSKTPNVRASFTIHLESPPFQNSQQFRLYQTGELFNLSGDLTGDGFNDLVIQDRADRLAVYAGKAKGFGSRPVLTHTIEPGQHFGITDIDGDKRADLAVRWTHEQNGQWAENGRVWLTREAGL
jgi:hypothetical protein